MGGGDDDGTPVWVRTDLLESSLLLGENGGDGGGGGLGGARTGAGRRRPLPGAGGKRDRDWGWTRARMLPSPGGGSGGGGAGAGKWRGKENVANAPVGGSGGLGGRGKQTASVRVVVVDDGDSPHHGRTVTLASPSCPKSLDEGVVMANSWSASSSSSSSQPQGLPPDDLIHLTHLHEPAVVHCLRARYGRDVIYTSTGPILLALNPFKRCGGLYSAGEMRRYREAGGGRAGGGGGGDGEADGPLPPHIFGVGDGAFRSMMRVLEDRDHPDATGGNGDQSILVSGESGAGKTVTTKFIMQYLATLSSSSSGDGDGGGGGGSIEQQVLQSNPILESFGNARTLRNDNSSRFGKFIEIRFAATAAGGGDGRRGVGGARLVGASVRTYLLEKVRLIAQAPSERNYHVFYEVLEGATPEERERWHLAGTTRSKNRRGGGRGRGSSGAPTPLDFKMTSSSGTFDRRDGVRDVDTHGDMRRAMDTIGFTEEERDNSLAVACALLHSSNLTFLESDDGGGASGGSELDESNPSLSPAASLLGVTEKALGMALCSTAIEARGERLVRALSPDRAAKALEAFIKATYGALFSFLVRRVNESITVRDDGGDGGGGAGGTRRRGEATIGVLDIFGFESFAVNSFEQLCINYCNESLQQQFNRFVFALEQQEYEREGIEWSFIAFPDNQDVLDLIDRKHTGVLSVLDEQCRIAGGTDRSFANSAYGKCGDHARFEASTRQRSSGQFSVRHYAGPVEYTASNFLEKNKDELPKESTELLISSSNDFVAHLGEILSSPTPDDDGGGRGGCSSVPTPSGGRSTRRQSSSGSLSRVSVGGQFSAQLRQLRERIDQTTPHYVRCLKPNDDLVPDDFDPAMIADQLRCAGVLEAVRVSRVGFPQRYPHDMFVKRYRILAVKDLDRASKLRRRNLCEVLVDAVAGQMQTAISCTPGEAGSQRKLDSPKHRLMSHRSSPKDLISVGLQLGKTKVFLRRQAFDTLELLRGQKLECASIRLQSEARRMLARRTYLAMLSAVVHLQCTMRRHAACRKVNSMRRDRAAVLLQRSWRRTVAFDFFLSVVYIARWSQKVQRGRKGRSRFRVMNAGRKAVVIQQSWRRCYYSKRYGSVQRLTLNLQCLFRSRCSKRALRDLKCKARDLANVAGERDRLRLEAEQMRKELAKAKQRAQEEAEKAMREAKEEAAIARQRAQEETQRAKQIAMEEVARAKQQAKELMENTSNVGSVATTGDTGASAIAPDSIQDAATVVYRNFPESPTAQEEELRHLAEISQQKDTEIQALRRELETLRGEKHCIHPYSNAPDAGHGFNLRNLWSRGFGLGELDPLHADPREGDCKEVNDEPPLESEGIQPSCTPTKDVAPDSPRRRFFSSPSMLQKFPGVAFIGRSTPRNEGASPTFSVDENASQTDCSNAPFISSSPTPTQLRTYVVSPVSTINSSPTAKSDVLDSSEKSCRSTQRDSFSSDEERQDMTDASPAATGYQAPASFVSSSTFCDESVEELRFHAAVEALDEAALLEAVKDCTDLNVEINMGNHKGQAPLHLASLKSSVNMAAFLLEHSAVSNAQDNNGNTPLHFAVEYRMVKLLLGDGRANPNIPNANGLCALHMAAQRRDDNAVECLVAHGADANVADDVHWCTPLHLVARNLELTIDCADPTVKTLGPDAKSHLAASSSAVAIAKMLCEAKADVNSQDRDGNTPLHHAAMMSQCDAKLVLDVMMQSGGDPNVQNLRGQTPLILLSHNLAMRQFDFYQELLLLLLAHGDPNISSKSGCTALHMVMYHQDIDSAVHLVDHGANLNAPWRKPSQWKTFWADTGLSEVLPVDMVRDEDTMRRLIAAINHPPKWAESRPVCMQCKSAFGTFVRQHHCRHCGRLVCGSCSPRSLDLNCFPASFLGLDGPKSCVRVCVLCEDILTAKAKG